MAGERSTTTIRLARHDAGWEIAWGTEALVIPVPVAEAMAHRILDQAPESGPATDVARAAIAVAASVSGAQ